jgi:hypothetical protein
VSSPNLARSARRTRRMLDWSPVPLNGRPPSPAP